MDGEFANLSELELLSLIHRAQEELANRREAAKQRLRSRFEEELKKAGLGLGDVFPDLELGAARSDSAAETEQKRSTPKFRNHVSGDTWSGRGPHPPRWVKDVMAERGWSVEDFKASEEYLA